MRAMLMLLCLLAAFAAQAQIYKKVLPDGTVVFTDEPMDGAEPIKVQPLPTYRAPPAKTKSESSPAERPAPEAGATKQPTTYKHFAIQAPSNDATVRDNSGAVPVTLGMEPALATEEGHTVSLLLDGKPVAAPGTATSFTLEAVDRGSHTLEAVLLDATGKTLRRSSPVVFHLMRHSAR